MLHYLTLPEQGTLLSIGRLPNPAWLGRARDGYLLKSRAGLPLEKDARDLANEKDHASNRVRYAWR